MCRPELYCAEELCGRLTPACSRPPWSGRSSRTRPARRRRRRRPCRPAPSRRRRPGHRARPCASARPPALLGLRLEVRAASALATGVDLGLAGCAGPSRRGRSIVTWRARRRGAGQLREPRVRAGQRLAAAAGVLADQRDVGEHDLGVLARSARRARPSGVRRRSRVLPSYSSTTDAGHLGAQRCRSAAAGGLICVVSRSQLGAGLRRASTAALVVALRGGVGLLGQSVDPGLHGVDVWVVGGCSRRGSPGESETHRGESSR